MISVNYEIRELLVLIVICHRFLSLQIETSSWPRALCMLKSLVIHLNFQNIALMHWRDVDWLEVYFNFLRVYIAQQKRYLNSGVFFSLWKVNRKY